MIYQRVIHMVKTEVGNLVMLHGWQGNIFYGIIASKDKNGINVLFHNGDLQYYLNDELETEAMYILEVS